MKVFYPIPDLPENLSSVEKGRIATAQVMSALTSYGVEIYAPVLDNGSCDLISLDQSGVRRIEVKYGSVAEPSGSITVALRQVRHNSKGNKVKTFNSEQCEILAVYFAPWDKVVLFEAGPLHGRSYLTCSPEHAQENNWK